MPQIKSGRDLDSAVALKVMGRTITDRHARMGRAEWSDATDRWCAMPHYSSSRDDAALIEVGIERRGLTSEYVAHLLDEVGIERDGTPFSFRDVWRIRRATPEQICRAALAAVRGAK